MTALVRCRPFPESRLAAPQTTPHRTHSGKQLRGSLIRRRFKTVSVKTGCLSIGSRDVQPRLPKPTPSSPSKPAREGEAMANTILIVTGVIIVALDLVTAFVFDPKAAVLGAMGAYVAMSVSNLVEERRALSEQEKGE